MSASPSVWLGSPAGLLVVTLVRGDIGGRGDARWVFAVRGAMSLPGGRWALRLCFFPCSSLPWDIFFYHPIQEAHRGLPAVSLGEGGWDKTLSGFTIFSDKMHSSYFMPC